MLCLALLCFHTPGRDGCSHARALTAQRAICAVPLQDKLRQATEQRDAAFQQLQAGDVERRELACAVEAVRQELAYAEAARREGEEAAAARAQREAQSAGELC